MQCPCRLFHTNGTAGWSARGSLSSVEGRVDWSISATPAEDTGASHGADRASSDPAPPGRPGPRPLYVDRDGHPHCGRLHGLAPRPARADGHPELHGARARAGREGARRDHWTRGPALPPPLPDPPPLPPPFEPHAPPP